MSRAAPADECEATYALGALLGSGSFAAVRRGVHRVDGSAWAVKIVSKAALSAEDAAGALPRARARAHVPFVRTSCCLWLLCLRVPIVWRRPFLSFFFFLLLELLLGGRGWSARWRRWPARVSSASLFLLPPFLSFAALKDEVEIMFPLRHPNIVQLRQVYDGPTSVSLVMELMAGASVAFFFGVSLPANISPFPCPPPSRPFLWLPCSAQAASCLTAS
jgi:serine/threonine protein kinase